MGAKTMSDWTPDRLREFVENCLNHSPDIIESVQAAADAWEAQVSLPEPPAAWVTPRRYGSQVTFYKPSRPDDWPKEEWYCLPLYYSPPRPSSAENPGSSGAGARVDGGEPNAAGSAVSRHQEQSGESPAQSAPAAPHAGPSRGWVLWYRDGNPIHLSERDGWSVEQVVGTPVAPRSVTA